MITKYMQLHFQISLILFNLTYIKSHFWPDTPAIGKTDQKIPISVSKISATNIAFFLRKCKKNFAPFKNDVPSLREFFKNSL